MAAAESSSPATAADLQLVLSCVPTAALKACEVQSSQRITVRVRGCMAEWYAGFNLI